MEDKVYDLVVVGAGIFGLQAVRTFLEIHPDANVIGLEADDHVGGVWSSHRFYDGFWTQLGHGTCEFSDRRMDLPQKSDIRNGLFNAKYVHEYLERYLDDHVFAGRPLRERFHCGFHVAQMEKKDGLWYVSGRSNANPDVEEVYTSAKVIVASGQTSFPNVPSLPDSGFKGETIHIKDFGKHVPALLSAPPKHVVVLGGGKSAADMAFIAARAGHTVTWVIRRSGHGPGLFAVPRKIGPYRNPSDLMLSRLGGTFSPSPLQPYTRWMWFLHTTRLGRSLLLSGFRAFSQDSWKHAKWTSMANAKKGYELLRPDTDAFFLEAPIGFIQDPSFWPTIAEKVQVYRTDIEALTASGVQLSDEHKTVVPCDALLLGTGFKSILPFLNAAEHVRLGLSHDPSSGDDEIEWTRLTEEADQALVRRFPVLAQRRMPREKHSLTPMRLYNAVGPINDRSIAFVGFISAVSNFMAAELQALWAVAWLDRSPLLNVPSEQAMKHRIASDTLWSRRRYPYSSGISGTTYDLECIPYGDRLLAELGLRSHLEGVTWWKYWTRINYQKFYANIIPEYIRNLQAAS